MEDHCPTARPGQISTQASDPLYRNLQYEKSTVVTIKKLEHPSFIVFFFFNQYTLVMFIYLPLLVHIKSCLV